MTLNFTLKREKVEFEGGDILVRGLNFPDLSKFIEINRDAIIPLFDKYSGRNPETLMVESSGEILLDVLKSAPIAVAHIIALASDNEGEIDRVATIPMGAMIEIIGKIGELTFKTSGGAGNVVAVVTKLIQNTAAEKASHPR